VSNRTDQIKEALFDSWEYGGQEGCANMHSALLDVLKLCADAPGFTVLVSEVERVIAEALEVQDV